MTKNRETWGTHTGMIWAMIGTEVGLGNIWRFPYLVSNYGGGSFLIPYLILLFSVALIGMMAEWAIGRATRRDPLGAFQAIKCPQGKKIGSWGIIGPFFLDCYYLVITAWVLYYVFASVTMVYFGKDRAEFFINFLSSKNLFIAHAIVVFICSLILALGVEKGIERSCKFMIPTLFILLIILMIRSVTLPGAAAGIEFFLRPRWEYLIKPSTWFAALGQIFFTLSLGMGAMIVYGSYLKKSWSIPQNAIACALGNTSSSILAGFVIFPAAFALGMGDIIGGKEGIGLTFIVLPKLFEAMPWGALFGTSFFVLLLFGALTSAVSIQEPAISWVHHEFGWSRKKGAFVTGFVLWLLGFPFILNGLTPGGLDEKVSLLGKMDTIIGQLALPLFGFVSIIALAWVMKDKGWNEINHNSKYKFGPKLKFWTKFCVPFIMLLLFGLTLLKTLGINLPFLAETPGEPFVPQGMGLSTVLMIIIVCGLVWGGFLYFTLDVIRDEKRKG